MAENEKANSHGISCRVKQLFAGKQFNDSSAARKLDYSAPSKLYGTLLGTTAPAYFTITQVLEKWPDLSAEWLTMGRRPMRRTGAAQTQLAGCCGKFSTLGHDKGEVQRQLTESVSNSAFGA